jgi:signal transduction histidine kinase
MGLGGSTNGPPLSAAPVRPLYRDDEDGTQAARLKRFRTVEIPAAARKSLLARLERAARVIGAGWAALLVEAGQATEVLTTSNIPASLHRLLADMRYAAGTMSAPPAYVVQRAASQGFVLVMRPVTTTGEVQGHVLLGFPHSNRPRGDFDDSVALVADDISAFLESHSLTGRMDRVHSHLSLIHRLGQMVTSIREREQLFAKITELVYASLGFDHVQLLLTDEEQQRVSLVHAAGPLAENLLSVGFSEDVGRGIIGRVAHTGHMWMSQNVSQDAHFVSNALLPNTASELAMPLRLGHRVMGVLDIQSDRPDAFRQNDILLLQTVADQIAPAIEQHRLLAAERRERELANTLADVSRIISSRLDPRHVLEAVLMQLGRVVPNRGSRVTLMGEDGRMRVVAAKGYPDNALVKRYSFVPSAAPLSRPVIEAHRTLIIDDVRNEPDWVWQPGTEQIVSWCSAPLVHGNDCIGWLCVDWPEPGFFKAEHGRVVRAFADQAVVAIENARLFERSRELSDILEYKVADRTRLLREAHDEIATKARELHALWRRVVDVQERERQRIAYDLHDSVAQSIMAATYQLQTIRKRLRGDEDLDHRLTECQATLDASLTEMKQIIYALRPNVLDGLGLVAALENYLGALPQGAELETSLSVRGTPTALSPEAELAIFRIVQEACQNAIRHAEATSLTLHLTYSGRSVDVRIVDDGHGFVFDDAKMGLGLVGIRERTQVVGGALTIKTAPGEGTLVMFSIPLEASAA